MDNRDDERGRTKTCNVCEVELPLSDFHRQTKSPDGHQYRCKSCATRLTLEWQKRWPDRTNQKNRNWKQDHKEQVSLSNAAYKEANKEQINIYGREYMRKRRAAMSPEALSAHYRKGDLWKHYRLRPEQYDAMFDAQGRVCAICKTADFGARRPHVDHSHATGKNRGLLCQHCNTTLHQLDVTPGWIEAAAQYLNLHKGD